MKKYIFILAIISIFPSVAFASWWNPTTWNIFSYIFHNDTQSQKTSITTSSTTNNGVDISNDWTFQSTLNSSATASDAEASVPIVAIPVKKSVKKVPSAVSVTPIIQTQSPQPIQSTGTLCNGTYWNECPAGQNFICPSTGNAYCKLLQQPVQVIQPPQSISDTDSNNTCNLAKQNLLTFQEQNPYMMQASTNPNIRADVSSGRSSLLAQRFYAQQATLRQAIQYACQ